MDLFKAGHILIEQPSLPVFYGPAETAIFALNFVNYASESIVMKENS